jgi:hypothetical protein
VKLPALSSAWQEVVLVPGQTIRVQAWAADDASTQPRLTLQQWTGSTWTTLVEQDWTGSVAALKAWDGSVFTCSGRPSKSSSEALECGHRQRLLRRRRRPHVVGDDDIHLDPT